MVPIILSSLIFLVTLGLIYSEKINRAIVGMAGAALMVAIGMAAGFYTQEDALASIDFNTLGLLMGMMILVALLEPTGFFEFLAVKVGQFSQGRPIRLMVLLGAVTTVTSMFLDNVTTVVLIAPVTILICEILELKPRPFLMAEALLSNTGGVATLVGDPPNILIASAANLSFTDFLVKSLPIVAVVWFVALGMLLWLYRDELHPEGKLDTETLMQLNPGEAFKDRKTAKRALIVIGLAVFLFLIEERLHLKPAFVALGMSSLALIWISPSIQDTLKRVEWDILLFFGSLFVLVGGMDAAGVLESLARIVTSITHLPPVFFGLLLLWLVAILSAIVDNIPITIALIPIIQGLGNSGVDIAPLWWALAFGAGFGGNGTIIGSTANVIVTSLSERTRTPITPALWSKRGLPVMMVTCTVASILYVIYYQLIGF